ncbi:MAG: type II toxin-antitoxin system YafQ family toxin [bacterium]
MNIIRTDSFKRDYKRLPEKVKRKAEKSLQLLVANLSHPSLRTKKIKSRENIWEARVAKDYRFSFETRGDTYVLRRIGRHESVNYSLSI